MMYKINRFIVIVSQLILLIDNTKQSKFKLGLAAFKAVGKTLKNPMVKKIGDTIKNSVSMLNQNKNTIKNFACSLEKTVLTARHKFGSRAVKYLGEAGIKHTVPQISRQGKKSIQMRSAGQISGKAKGFMPMAKGHLRGSELMSFVSAITKSKPFAPFMFAAGGLGTLQMNLVATTDGVATPDPKAAVSTDETKAVEEKKEVKPWKPRTPLHPLPDFAIDMKKDTPQNEVINSVKDVQEGDKFDPSERQAVRDRSNAFYAAKVIRKEAFVKAGKKLFHEFTTTNLQLRKDYDKLNREQAHIFRRRPRKVADDFKERNEAYRALIKTRTETYEAAKLDLMKKYEDVHRGHLKAHDESNHGLKAKLKEFNEEYIKDNGQAVIELIKKKKILTDQLKELETARVAEFSDGYTKKTDELKAQEIEAKEAMKAAHWESKNTIRSRKADFDALEVKYTTLRDELTKDFNATNEASALKYRETNKEALAELKETATLLKQKNHEPFREFLDLHKDNMRKIINKSVDPNTGAAIGIILKKEEIQLKEEYEHYTSMFPPAQPPKKRNLPKKNYKRRK